MAADDVQEEGPHGVSPTLEIKKMDEKDNAFTTEHDVEHGMKFEAEEEGVTAVVETAEDLVTKVIHVEDDPNMPVLTFRVIFLGCLSYERRLENIC